MIVDFVGRLAPTKDSTEGPIFQSAKDWLVVVADKDVVPALELGIRFLNIGDTGLIWSHSKFAYGPLERKHGDYTLPPDSNVIYEVTVKSVIGEEEQADPSFNIRASTAKKDIGNDAYANEWADGQGQQKAIRLYQRGAETLEYLLQTNEDEEIVENARSVLLDCLNNVVAVYMRAKEYHLAKEAAVKVLTHDPDNFKALIRAAKASLLDPASSYEEASAAINAAAERSPNDADVLRLKAQLKKQKQEYKKKSKEMFSKLGQSSATDKSEAKADEAAPPPQSQPTEAIDQEPPSHNWMTAMKPLFYQLLFTLLIFLGARLARLRLDRMDDETPTSEL